MVDMEAMTPAQRAEYIGKQVERWRTDDDRQEEQMRRAYYRTKNPPIMARKKLYAGAMEAGDGSMRAVAKENRFAANEHVASSFFRDITDQKVQYLMGEGADVNAVDDDDQADALVASVYDPIGEQLKRVGQMALTDALVYKAGYTYLQMIAGRPKLTCVPYTEVVPYRDDYDELAAVMRCYKRDGRERAEWHTAAKVYDFERGKDDKEWRQTGERWQIQTVTVYGDGTVADAGGKAWARLPWFEMWAENGRHSSLTNAVRTMIDVYDVTVSDFANNLIDIQDAFIVLKNSGYGSGIAYDEQLDLLRSFKVTESDADFKTVEVPYQARQVLLDMLKADIYAALRGVDVGRISGGNLTNTAIRALYSDIDLWADQAEWWVKDWVRAVMDTLAAYMGVELPLYKITLTRNAIFDDIERMQAVAAQKGVISDKTLFEAHPLVSDAQAELERVEAEAAGAAYGIDLGEGMR